MGGVSFYGARQIFSKKKKFFASSRILGALIVTIFSLLPLVVSIIVVDGMIEGISERFICLGDSHIKVFSFDKRSKDEVKNAIDSVRKHNQVVSVIPTVTSRGLVINKNQNKKSAVEIKGMVADFFEQDAGYKKYLKIEAGTPTLSEQKSVMLSSVAAKNLNVSVGDEVDVMMIVTLAGNQRPIKGSYKVTGIFSTGYYQLDNISLYMNYDRVFPLFYEKGVDLLVKVKNPHSDIYQTTNELREILNANSSWQVSSWQLNNRTLFRTLEDTRFLIFIILIGILLVTSFNILSTFFSIVKEKECEIAILKSFGVEPKKIICSFLFSGFILSLVGTILGVAFGLLVGVKINGVVGFIENLFNHSIISSDYYLDEIPIKIDFIKLSIISILSIIFSLFFTLLPALKIAKIKPIELLRRH